MCAKCLPNAEVVLKSVFRHSQAACTPVIAAGLTCQDPKAGFALVRFRYRVTISRSDVEPVPHSCGRSVPVGNLVG